MRAAACSARLCDPRNPGYRPRSPRLWAAPQTTSGATGGSFAGRGANRAATARYTYPISTRSLRHWASSVDKAESVLSRNEATWTTSQPHGPRLCVLLRRLVFHRHHRRNAELFAKSSTALWRLEPCRVRDRYRIGRRRSSFVCFWSCNTSPITNSATCFTALRSLRGRYRAEFEVAPLIANSRSGRSGS